MFKGLVLTKQLATTSQPVNNPIYTGMPSNIDNMNQQLPVVDTVSISHVNHVPTNTNKSDVQMKNNVRCTILVLTVAIKIIHLVPMSLRLLACI